MMQTDTTPLLLASVIVFFLMTVTGGVSHASEAPLPKKTSKHEFTHDKLNRNYDLHLPAGFDKSLPRPVVFVLHGGATSAETTLGMRPGDFVELSDKEGFIAVYPNGYPDQPGSNRHHWNDGRNLRWAAHKKNIDDVGFFSSLIDHFIKIYNAEPQRIYAVGASNGGIMCYRLGCELSDKIAAIASVIANLPVHLYECAPSRPVSVLIMNGTNDPLMPWEGGMIRFRGLCLGEVLSTAETVKFWLKRNKCAVSPIITMEPDKDPEDGTRVRREVYSPCKDGSEVRLYAIENGGHTWPGGFQYLPENLIGKTNQDIASIEVIWEFFKRHAKR